MLDALQLRFSLVGGMFDAIQKNSTATTDWAILFTQLICQGVIDLSTNRSVTGKWKTFRIFHFLFLSKTIFLFSLSSMQRTVHDRAGYVGHVDSFDTDIGQSIGTGRKQKAVHQFNEETEKRTR